MPKPVTAFCGVVESVMAPAEEPPVGGAMVILSSVLAGMLELISTVMMRLVSLVVIAYVAGAVAWVGCDPATAVLITRFGEPATVIRLIDWTSMPTDCVAV